MCQLPFHGKKSFANCTASEGFASNYIQISNTYSNVFVTSYFKKLEWSMRCHVRMKCFSLDWSFKAIRVEPAHSTLRFALSRSSSSSTWQDHSEFSRFPSKHPSQINLSSYVCYESPHVFNCQVFQHWQWTFTQFRLSMHTSHYPYRYRYLGWGLGLKSRGTTAEAMGCSYSYIFMNEGYIYRFTWDHCVTFKVSFQESHSSTRCWCITRLPQHK